ncbi:MAG: apolipoprotein N-acyltransferase [Rhodospirillales bacterium 12-54-5]|nr:MAG: apolipoprotein N-acyltransferase [Rhodospirillales bacterium 12-54-5]
MRTPNTLINLVRFAVLWVAIEYARSIGMFGFPWNLLGSMALAVPPVAQAASLIGTFGLSLLLILLFTLPVLWVGHDITKKQQKIAILGALGVLVGVVVYAEGRMPMQAAPSNTRIRVVQGNIAQAMKWTQQGAIDAEQTYSELTQAASTTGQIPSIVIWPETAVPIPLRRDSQWPRQVGVLLPKNGLLLTGALRIEQGGVPLLWNSLLAIQPSGTIAAMYDKHQLVPFGEFVPLRSVLPLDKITPGNLDFSRGEGIKTLSVDGFPAFHPLICYEVIFPWDSASTADAPRPAWLVNLTNDGWYGDSPGPYQHLAAAQLRAIEQGLPLVRAANTGISAVIDPYGRIQQSLPLGTRGVIDATLPEALPRTLYAQWGEWITLLLLGVLMLATLVWPRLSQTPAHSDTHQ